MRKLFLILLAFIAIFTFIRTMEEPSASELWGDRQQEEPAGFGAAN